MRHLACVVLLAAAPPAHAEPAIRDVEIRWVAPEGAEIIGYVMYRKRGTVEERVELGLGTATGGCELIRVVTVGFLRFGSYTVTLAAVGPAGESVRSGAIKIPSCLTAGAPGCGPTSTPPPL